MHQNLFESVLSNRKHHLISLPAFNVTKVTATTQSKFETPDGQLPGVSLYERTMKKKTFLCEQL